VASAAADDVQHVGCGQDFVTAAEPNRARQRVEVSALIHEADAIRRVRDGEMRGAGGIDALVRHLLDRARRHRTEQSNRRAGAGVYRGKSSDEGAGASPKGAADGSMPFDL
jgi:hypothetical protein